ncbi:MAG: hypothetical protein AAB677_01005 [Patescibacteria group bacterium]
MKPILIGSVAVGGVTGDFSQEARPQTIKTMTIILKITLTIEFIFV